MLIMHSVQPQGCTQATILTLLSELVSLAVAILIATQALHSKRHCMHKQGRSEPRPPRAKTDETVRPIRIEKSLDTVWLYALELLQHAYMEASTR